MSACFHFLSTPRVKQELSGDFLPKHYVSMRKSLTIAAQNPLSFCKLRIRSFERGVEVKKADEDWSKLFEPEYSAKTCQDF